MDGLTWLEVAAHAYTNHSIDTDIQQTHTLNARPLTHARTLYPVCVCVGVEVSRYAIEKQ